MIPNDFVSSTLPRINNKFKRYDGLSTIHHISYQHVLYHNLIFNIEGQDLLFVG